MYHPQTVPELFDILRDLQHYAQLQGLPELSETLADALLIFAQEEQVSAQSGKVGVET